MGKGSSGRFYEDFQVGMRLECAGPRTVTDADRAAWIGFTGDPIARYGTGREVHPLLVFAFTHGQVSRDVHGRTQEELGATSVVMHRPVEVGATLNTTARVIGLREDPDRDTGVVWVRVAGRDVRGVVVSYVTWFRVPKKHRQSRHAADMLPSLSDHVPVTELYSRDVIASPRHETGGRFAFDDYLEHETIHHGPTHTVAAGDITRFARWFRQTDARHQDPGHPHAAAPLAQVVGIAYALAHDGVEDRIGLRAINAFRTPHALREGDRLYAMSQVAATQNLTPLLGVVRFRLFLFRNHDPKGDERPLITEGKRYLPHIALDMDYWELVPTEAGLRR
ncbi:MAG: hypothetical protein H6737_02355 [Alphaproteobacteria bacterium]|nr:hypothetical protein [Alphaproteobacteria bacterium]